MACGMYVFPNNRNFILSVPDLREMETSENLKGRLFSLLTQTHEKLGMLSMLDRYQCTCYKTINNSIIRVKDYNHFI